MLHLPHRRCSRCAVLAIACTLGLISVQGCKTQKDAEAAAEQMAVTSKVLRDYYQALDRILGEWQDAYEAQRVIDNTQPEDLSKLREQMRHRAALAVEIGDLAAVFQKLTGSTAASDASAAAGKLNDDAVTLAGLTANDAQTQAVTTGVKAVVQLIQQHDERKAAEKMAPLCHDLVVFFESEKDRYVMISRSYDSTARNVARAMVRRNQVDPSSVFLSSLHPFGLAPAIQDSSIRQTLQPYLLAQIDVRRDGKDKQAEAAADALDQCLQEMDHRVDLVAHRKSMPLRLPPFSLETVKSWIDQAGT